MHIPDGFLDGRVCAATGVASAVVVGAALRQLRPESDASLAPRMGITAAYVFAAQMVNFPVAAGTSGHLLGAVLAAVLLGPHAAAVAMAAVFLIQTLFFLDGGHTALGANVLNMGLAGAYGGYAVYRAIAGPTPGRTRLLAAVAVAAWLAVMLGASLTAAELAFSGTIPGRLVFPAMLGVHALIGLGEAAITAAAVGLLLQVRPDLITGRESGPSTGARWGWAVAAGLAAVAALAPLASPDPDGLERVAGRLGFEEHARDPLLPGPMPDYTLPGVEAGWAPALVSVIGAFLLVATLLPLARARRGAGEGERWEPRRLDARVKLASLLALVLTTVFLPPSGGGKVLLLLLLSAGWVLAARVPLRWLAGRGLLLLPFVGLAALSLPALREPGAGASWFGLLFLRAIASLLATAAFVASTPEGEVLTALRAFRLPAALTQTLAFALRYLRVLGDEGHRMLQARASRSAGAGTLALRAQGTGGIVGSLFVRSFERAERVSLAMAARGGLSGRAQHESGQLSAADLAFVTGFALFLGGVWMWG